MPREDGRWRIHTNRTIRIPVCAKKEVKIGVGGQISICGYS